jgi:hypothetical protein
MSAETSGLVAVICWLAKVEGEVFGVRRENATEIKRGVYEAQLEFYIQQIPRPLDGRSELVERMKQFALGGLRQKYFRADTTDRACPKLVAGLGNAGNPRTMGALMLAFCDGKFVGVAMDLTRQGRDVCHVTSGGALLINRRDDFLPSDYLPSLCKHMASLNLMPYTFPAAPRRRW